MNRPLALSAVCAGWCPALTYTGNPMRHYHRRPTSKCRLSVSASMLGAMRRPCLAAQGCPLRTCTGYQHSLLPSNGSHSLTGLGSNTKSRSQNHLHRRCPCALAVENASMQGCMGNATQRVGCDEETAEYAARSATIACGQRKPWPTGSVRRCLTGSIAIAIFD